MRGAHDDALGELAEEVLRQAVTQVGREAPAAVDAERRGQWLPQLRQECIPLALRHDVLP